MSSPEVIATSPRRRTTLNYSSFPGYAAFESQKDGPKLNTLRRGDSFGQLSKVAIQNAGEYEPYRKDKEELKVAIQNAGEYEPYRKDKEELKAIKKKKIREFYEHQNATIDQFSEVDDILRAALGQGQQGGSVPLETEPLLQGLSNRPKTTAGTSPSLITLVINLNFLLNFGLLAGKVVAVLVSTSISLVASLIDSGMDLLSTLIIWFANRKSNEQTWYMRYEYPTGRKRFEPMGVAIFSAAMITSFAQVFIESVERLISKETETAVVPTSGLIVMLITIGTKFFVWISCRSLKNVSIKALAQDAENDVVFNSMSLLFPFIGQKFDLPWLDPAGGLILSLYIIYEWFKTLIENVHNLTGKRGTAQDHQRVLYLVTRFSPLIQGIHHVEVFRNGDELICEVDIILPTNTPLPVAHNVGEGLQFALEHLEGVSRAYVHLDFTSGPSSHVNQG
ncbi:hypothetical protein BT69DRAFT_482983 [Atractiella rhizophila]|nr:hypothetical protein BT69DRAFT_482983 [Atractiella rhizophila]